MPCCAPFIQMFVDVATTTILYSSTMSAAFGVQPRVDIYYFDPDLNEYYTDNGTPGSGTAVKFDGASVFIDHGGPASGYVKLS